MTPAEVTAEAARRNRAFLASLDPQTAPAPPHREQSGRAAPGRAAMVREKTKQYAAVLQGTSGRLGPGRPSCAGAPCSRCKAVPRIEGRSYCPACSCETDRKYRRDRRERAKLGLPARGMGRPRKSEGKPAVTMAA